VYFGGYAERFYCILRERCKYLRERLGTSKRLEKYRTEGQKERLMHMARLSVLNRPMLRSLPVVTRLMT